MKVETMYIKTTTSIRGGEFLEITKSKKIPPKNAKRSSRKNKTTFLQEIINHKHAVNNLRLLELENFNKGDFFCTLTYQKEPTPQKAKKEIVNCMRRLKRICKDINKDAVVKYIYVTHCKTGFKNEKQPLKYGRIHHHVLLRFENLDMKTDDKKKLIFEKWRRGFVDTEIFKGTLEDAERLAKYMLKKDSNAFFTQSDVIKKRWNASRNVKMPQRKTEPVHRKNWLKDPKDTNTHYVDKSSVINGSYPIGEGYENEYQFYRMIRKLPKIPPLISS